MRSAAAQGFYDVPPFGNVHLLHFTDCHAQLLPIVFPRAERQPRRRRRGGQAAASGRRGAAEALRHRRRHARGARLHLSRFRAAARTYGKVGGFAHLATLVKRLKAERPGALLLDGGDTWQGSATSLWTRGQDMVEARALLGVD